MRACDFSIDECLQAVIPPLTVDERAQLEANLIAQGCRDPLVVWQEQGVILDGHNRLAICQRLDIPYQVVYASFSTREAAVAWIINNQLGRRNLHPDHISVLRGRRYNLEKAAPGAPIGNNNRAAQRDQNEPVERTADRLATEYKVSPATIKRDGKFAEAVSTLEAAGLNPHQVVAVAPKAAVVELAEAIEQAPPATAPVVADVVEQVNAGAISVQDAAPAITHNHRAQGTGENEWYTPAEYLDAARDVLGAIDLDPATSPLANVTVGAERIFTKSDDGLAQSWSGRVWLNPPYAQPAIAHFAEKLASEWEAGNLASAIALTHNYTDTAWFHRLAGACAAICFTRGRIGFVSPEGKKAAPTQGQAFFYFGGEVDRFQHHFATIGVTVRVLRAPLEQAA